MAGADGQNPTERILIMTVTTPGEKARKGLMATVSVAALAGLTACGGGSAEAYCDTLQEHVAHLSGLDASNPETMMGDGMEGIMAMMEEAGSDVPEEIASEHATVQEMFEEFSSIDFEALMDVEALMEMDQDEMAEMEAEFQALEERFEGAEADGERWGEWVEENCDIEDPVS